MAFRKRMSRKGANRTYRSGKRVKRKNMQMSPMRGGWRL